MTVKWIWLTLIVYFFLCSCQEQSLTNAETENTMELNEDWQFRKAGTEDWMDATVPGCVHTDLMNNGIIENPFYRLNEHDVQWVDKEDWEYITTFKADAKTVTKNNITLVFEGLDTHADVYLNDEKVLAANNMFRTWEVDVKDWLQEGNNELRIYFHSPIKVGLEKYDSLDYVIPVSDNDLSEIGGVGDKKVSVHLRKAGYHFGWDWGPRLVTSGVWKPVYLKAYNKSDISNLYVKQVNLTNEKAEMEAKVELETSGNANGSLVVLIDGEETEKKSVTMEGGKTTVSVPFEISNPKRWWPNGLGDAHLYNIQAVLLVEDEVISSAQANIGLRTIEIVQEEDTAGSSFLFKVNGHPVFMKGANYIPQDVFLNRVSPDDYEHIIHSAVESNMNMIRVWGGGIYEKDVFYDLCDENGILVWQDFMFACAMFPGDEAFLENVRQEATDNVRRLRNHPSIALWCGNNECLVAWYNWGWKEREEREQGEEVAERIWQSYVDIFHKVLPEVVEEHDSDRMYWASSPSAGMGETENWVDGDVHYWGVWWGKEPFKNYRTQIPRFMSEYGFQSFPELSTVKKYAEKEDWDIFSEVMKSHQRSSIGNGTIKTYMDRNYREPKDFPMFLYVGQLLQAEGTRVAMEGHRKNMPYCMGSLYWQLNDCWPVASWSTMDYYGNWKAQQYFAKKAFDDFLISPEINEGVTDVFVVSDKLENVSGNLDMVLMDFEGNTLWEESRPLEIKANTSEKVFSLSNSEILGTAKPENVVLHVRLSDGENNVLSKNNLYYVEVKNLNLPEPGIESKVATTDDGFRVDLTTDKLAKNVYLTTPDIHGFFSDNYFDLLPGETVSVTFTETEADDIENSLSVISLVDSYQ